MKNNRVILWYSLQLFLLIVLLLVILSNTPQKLLQIILLLSLLVITGLILYKNFQWSKQLKAWELQLQSVVGGNLNIRLLVDEQHLFNEIIFTINALIEAFARTEIEAERAKLTQKSLLANISHDLRTPLTSIIGYLDALQDDLNTSIAEKTEYLKIVSKKAAALKDLINEIFLMSKIDANELPLKMECLDLGELIRETLIEFLPELKREQFELVINLPKEPSLVSADHLSLNRVIGNLLKNVLQYGISGKILGIELIEMNQKYQVKIWDRGLGISPSDLTHIFERMYRTDRSRNTLHSGSGLGLAIAKVLIEKNSGEIWAESTPDEQTSFSFTLPKLRNN